MRKPLTWVLIVAVAVGVGFGLYWFAPWRLATNTTVRETLSTPEPAVSLSPTRTSEPAAAGPKLLASGTFVTHEHDTAGQVRIIALPDGTQQLEIAGLATSDGPDLRVWLTDQQVTANGWRVFDDGRYVELGKLKGNRGDQVYPLPAGIDAAAFRSVTIWCKRFSVSFGAAPLA